MTALQNFIDNAANAIEKKLNLVQSTGYKNMAYSDADIMYGTYDVDGSTPTITGFVNHKQTDYRITIFKHMSKYVAYVTVAIENGSVYTSYHDDSDSYDKLLNNLNNYIYN